VDIFIAFVDREIGEWCRICVYLLVVASDDKFSFMVPAYLVVTASQIGARRP
jgi:hypothetical protein